MIATSEKDPDLETRLQMLYRETTLAVYTNISRGLFEHHKLIFSFMLCVNIMLKANEISEAAWSFLIRGPVGSKTSAEKPGVPQLTDQIWTAVKYLEDTWKNFAKLDEDCVKLINIEIGDFKLVRSPDDDFLAEILILLFCRLLI